MTTISFTVIIQLRLGATALLFSIFALPAFAQTALSLDPAGCVYREGDDVRWASANLDESGWLPLASWPGVATRTPYYWLRCRFELGPLDPAIMPAVQVTGDLNYEIYIDGKLVGSFGDLATGNHTVGMFRDYRNPALSRRSGRVLVALRMAFTPEILVIQPMPELTLGDAAYMRGQYSEQVLANLEKRWINWVSCGLIGAAGLFFFGLFWFDRSQSYLLWAGVTWISIAELRVNEYLHMASIPYPARTETFLYCVGQFMGFSLVVMFFRLADRPVNQFYRLVACINLVSFASEIPIAFLPLRAMMELRWLVDVSPYFGRALQSAWIITSMTPMIAFWPFAKLRRGQIPVACACFLWTATEVPYLSALFPGVHVPWQVLLAIQQYRSVAVLIVVATLTLLLIKRLRETNQQRATLAGEMLAARHIQQMLAPVHLDRAPGCIVEVVFLPAREVGGDFYLCRVLPGGRQRILFGDVSGKGAAAAMTAALLIGAAERRDVDSPALLLRHMNEVMCDFNVGGFATCLCADLTPEGRLTLANAGQLPPYRNGKELSCDAALPLGLAMDAAYSESTWELDAGDLITMLSDGVVEARNAAGELFGFHRTAEVSRQAAITIAQCAQDFGQEDDITVLTLQRLGTADAVHT